MAQGRWTKEKRAEQERAIQSVAESTASSNVKFIGDTLTTSQRPQAYFAVALQMPLNLQFKKTKNETTKKKHMKENTRKKARPKTKK